ncbi:MAG: hypothetical protein ACR2MB_14525 [Acidimicrobiales bacterium]
MHDTSTVVLNQFGSLQEDPKQPRISANGLALWTVNARDFAGIGRLDLVAVDHPDR